MQSKPVMRIESLHPLQISVDHKRIVPEIWGKQLGWRAHYQSPDADL
jgi:hypothetical protein